MSVCQFVSASFFEHLSAFRFPPPMASELGQIGVLQKTCPDVDPGFVFIPTSYSDSVGLDYSF